MIGLYEVEMNKLLMQHGPYTRAVGDLHDLVLVPGRNLVRLQWRPIQMRAVVDNRDNWGLRVTR